MAPTKYTDYVDDVLPIKKGRAPKKTGEPKPKKATEKIPGVVEQQKDARIKKALKKVLIEKK